MAKSAEEIRKRQQAYRESNRDRLNDYHKKYVVSKNERKALTTKKIWDRV
jgi:hypothetical protein